MSNNVCNFPKDCSADAQESRLKGGRDHEEQKESDRTNDIAGSGLQGDPNAIVVGSAAFSSHEGKSPLKPPAKETQAQQRRHSSLDSDIARTAPGDPNDVLAGVSASSTQQLPRRNAPLNPPAAEETQAEQGRLSSLASDLDTKEKHEEELGSKGVFICSLNIGLFLTYVVCCICISKDLSAGAQESRIQDGSDLEEQKASSCHGKNPERHLSDDKSLDKHDDVGLRTTVSVLEGNALACLICCLLTRFVIKIELLLPWCAYCQNDQNDDG